MPPQGWQFTANVRDFRPFVALVLAAVILTMQEYYGGRAFYDDAIRPYLAKLDLRRPAAIKLYQYDELCGFAWWVTSRVLGYVVVPFTVWKAAFRGDSLLDFGLRAKGFFRHAWIYALFLGVVLPALLGRQVAVALVHHHEVHPARVDDALRGPFVAAEMDPVRAPARVLQRRDARSVLHWAEVDELPAVCEHRAGGGHGVQSCQRRSGVDARAPRSAARGRVDHGRSRGGHRQAVDGVGVDRLLDDRAAGGRDRRHRLAAGRPRMTKRDLVTSFGQSVNQIEAPVGLRRDGANSPTSRAPRYRPQPITCDATRPRPLFSGPHRYRAGHRLEEGVHVAT